MSLPTYRCRRAADPLTIDGRLDEPAWDVAEAALLQRNEDGGPAPLATTVRLLWDDVYLYVGFTCEDPDIWGTLYARDSQLWEEEVVEVFLDPNHNGQLYFEFELSPRNVQLDLLAVKRPGRPLQTLIAWDCPGWQTAVCVDGTLDNRADRDRGWSAEMAIPLAELRTAPHTPRPGDIWRMGLYRIERPQNAPGLLLAWSPTLAATFHVPERFGYLAFEG